jgi:integrase
MKALQGHLQLGPMPSRTPRLNEFLEYWLREVVRPSLAPLTVSTYETFVRLYIGPYLGKRRLDQLQVRDVCSWLNRLRVLCQCCAQRKDARRPEGKRRCCAIGKCCNDVASERTVRDARAILRSALAHAMTEELVTRNAAALVPMQRARRRRLQPWTVEEVRAFLESARTEHDPMYAADVLILVLGLRKGDVLGLTWSDLNFHANEVAITHQLQRVGRQLRYPETKTEASEAILPLPDLCVTALKERRADQLTDAGPFGEAWPGDDFVFTTRFGTPVDPRNFNRSFATHPRSRRTAHLCDPAGGAGRSPPHSHADYAAQPDRDHYGRVYTHPFRGDPPLHSCGSETA